MFSSVYRRSAIKVGYAAAATVGVSMLLSFRNVAYNAGEKNLPQVYQYQICPYCHRVKAYLDYLKVQYEVVEVNPLTKSELAFSKDYKKVPLAVFDDEVVKGSGDIIEFIKKQYPPTKSEFIPSDSEKWTEWSEKRLAVLLYPNITRTREECWECFAYADNVESWSKIWKFAVRNIGPIAMSFANGRIKKKYGIVDERKELKEALEEWCKAVGGKKFLHGNEVSLPDLMVFGVLRSISGFQTFREIMSENRPLLQWYQNVSDITSSQESCSVSK